MFTTLISATVFTAAFAVRGVLADFAINTPVINQCQPFHITWQPTTAPYNVILVSQDDPCNSNLEDYGDHNGTHITVTSQLDPGTQVIISALDADGGEAWSADITVGEGDGSCLPGASVSVTTSTSTTSTTPTPSPTTLLVTDSTPLPGANGNDVPVNDAPSPSPSQSPAIPVGAANAGDNPKIGAAIANVRVDKAFVAGVAGLVGLLGALAL